MAHETRSLPPAAAVLAHLRPDDLAGLRTVAVAAMATGLAIWLSLSGHLLVWAAGQLVLAVALLQWFALLHECGHATLFRTRAWHAPVGHVAAFFSLIPFHAWKRVHGRHHKWTGWQDLDPTTETLAPRARGPIERTFVNVCWRCWIPAFAVVYRLGNFWNLTRLFRTFDSPVDRRAIVRDAAALVTVYASLAIALGPSLLRVAGLAIVLSFVLQETVLLSQHTHVPQQLSGGEDVVPYPAIAQEPFTRSLRLPSWLSWLVLHFDAHELHHMYPFVPGYALRRIPYDTAHEVAWWRWTASARRLRGEVLLFQNRHDSGWEI